jgi:hypothetical protein
MLWNCMLDPAEIVQLSANPLCLPPKSNISLRILN